MIASSRHEPGDTIHDSIQQSKAPTIRPHILDGMSYMWRQFSYTWWFEVRDPNVGTSNFIDIASPLLAIESTWELSCPLGNHESQILVISNVRFKVIEMQYLHKLLMKKLPKSSSFANSMNTYPSQTHDGVHLEHMVQSHGDMCFWCPFFATNLTIYHSSIGVQFIKSHNRRPT